MRRNKVSDYQEGVNAPPLHPNCRCTTVPYFDDEFTVDEIRVARDENGKTVQISSGMNYSDWLGKVGKSENVLYRNAKRREVNHGAFSVLEVPMQKRAVLRLSRKYNISLKGITIKIQRSEKLLALPYLGSTDYNNVGRVDLFPNAFKNETELIKTLLHERCHVKQLRKYGKTYVQNNLEKMERIAYRYEEICYTFKKR